MSTSPTPSLATTLSPDSHIISPFPIIRTCILGTIFNMLTVGLPSAASQSERPPALGASATLPLAHHRMIPHANPSSIKAMESIDAPLSLQPLSVSTSLNPTSQQVSPLHSFYSKGVPFAQSSASSINVVASLSFASNIRFALIGVLAGVPALTILGFVISFRCRRRRQATISSDRADLASKIKERNSGRLCSFFGVGTAIEDKDGRNDNRPICVQHPQYCRISWGQST